MAVLDGRQSSTGAALAIALHQSLLEDLVVAGVLDSIPDFRLAGVGAHDAVLAGHLILGALTELRLNLLVLLNSRLESAVDTANLRVVLGSAGVGVRLNGADALGKRAVLGHGLRGQRVKLAVGIARRGAVGVVECSLLNHAQLLEVALNLINTAVNVAALVENGVGVAAHRAGVLSQRLHLYVGARA